MASAKSARTTEKRRGVRLAAPPCTRCAPRIASLRLWVSTPVAENGSRLSSTRDVSTMLAWRLMRPRL
jgi:hypothetical protein